MRRWPGLAADDAHDAARVARMLDRDQRCVLAGQRAGLQQQGMQVWKSGLARRRDAGAAGAGASSA